MKSRMIVFGCLICFVPGLLAAQASNGLPPGCRVDDHIRSCTSSPIAKPSPQPAPHPTPSASNSARSSSLSAYQNLGGPEDLSGLTDAQIEAVERCLERCDIPTCTDCTQAIDAAAACVEKCFRLVGFSFGLEQRNLSKKIANLEATLPSNKSRPCPVAAGTLNVQAPDVSKVVDEDQLLAGSIEDLAREHGDGSSKDEICSNAGHFRDQVVFPEWNHAMIQTARFQASKRAVEKLHSELMYSGGVQSGAWVDSAGPGIALGIKQSCDTINGFLGLATGTGGLISEGEEMMVAGGKSLLNFKTASEVKTALETGTPGLTLVKDGVRSAAIDGSFVVGSQFAKIAPYSSAAKLIWDTYSNAKTAKEMGEAQETYHRELSNLDDMIRNYESNMNDFAARSQTLTAIADGLESYCAGKNKKEKNKDSHKQQSNASLQDCQP